MTTILQAVKTGATPAARHFAKVALQHAGLRVHCGNGTYRNFPTKHHGGLHFAVAAAIDAAINAPFAGEAPDDLLQRIEPLEAWEVTE